MMMEEREHQFREQLERRLRTIYKEDYQDKILEDILGLFDRYEIKEQKKKQGWNESDIILITYGDSVTQQNIQPLGALGNFLDERLPGFSIVHILPFFPYSSDDGFSVIDYREVDPGLGSWEDIDQLNERYDLLFDLVINHVSSKSKWFRNYLSGEGKGKDFFIEVDPDTDLSRVVRPRSVPLLTKVKKDGEERYVWTTFSSDQIDLNFKNPEVLVEMLDILLFYIKRGARAIRLDAIAYLWKEIGKSCIHLPETHEIVKLMRDVTDHVDPSVLLLTETNVPNIENLSYFGNQDEAHMVYQFSLPPLLLHALHRGKSEYLNRWAQTIPQPKKGNTYFNFTASHDGIGVRPLEGILPEEEIHQLIDDLKDTGALVSSRMMPDGSETPYEINITYFDALKETYRGPDQYQVERFLCSQTIMMSLQGIPAFYIHSLVATTNYDEGVKETGQARAINRRKWKREELDELLDRDTDHRRVFRELKRRIGIRKKTRLFHPDIAMQVMAGEEGIFVIKRFVEGEKDSLLSVSNLTPETRKIRPVNWLSDKTGMKDLLTGKTASADSDWELGPYQTTWLATNPS